MPDLFGHDTHLIDSLMLDINPNLADGPYVTVKVGVKWAHRRSSSFTRDVHQAFLEDAVAQLLYVASTADGQWGQTWRWHLTRMQKALEQYGET